MLKKIYAFWMKKRCNLHHEAISLYEGINFKLSMNYARTLTVMFVSFSYWSAFPILMYVFWIYIHCQYWIEKYMILRHYKIPLRISTSIHQQVIGIIPYSLPVHFLFSWWFFGSPGILGNWWYDPNRSGFSISSILTRIQSRYAIVFLFLGSIFGLALFLKNTLFRLKEWWTHLFQGAKIEPLGIARSFNQDKLIIQKTGLVTYDIRK